MKTYVINIKRRQDRCIRMQSVLPSWIKPVFTTYWDGPLDGRNVSIKTLQRYGLFPWRIPSDNMWWNRPLKKGEIGCSISHWLCWRAALKSNDSLFLFLEDDVCFVDNFTFILQAGLKDLCNYDPMWDLLYLGRVPLHSDQTALDYIVKPGYSHCTFAYMLARRAINKLLHSSFEKDIIPVDEFLPAMYINHPRKDVRTRYEKILSAYAFEPPIVYQLPKSEAGSDTEDSDFFTNCHCKGANLRCPVHFR